MILANLIKNQKNNPQQSSRGKDEDLGPVFATIYCLKCPLLKNDEMHKEAGSCEPYSQKQE